MKKFSRRQFLRGAAALGAGAVAMKAPHAEAAYGNIPSSDRKGVLVDTTVCVGCRRCEWACKTAHDLPAGDVESYKDRSVFKTMRRPSDSALTVVNEFRNPKNKLLPINVKVQCMHCDHPACVSACIVGALEKQENGSVIWDTGKCIGCRYCMVACPFQIPQFQYNKALEPEIRKCDFCFRRTREGKLPACVEICPVETMTYGPRSEVIKLAREKIRRNPDRFVDHILGEKEVDGTSWVYIANREFTGLGFPNLPNEPAPGVSESIQHGVFAYFVPPVLYFSLLGTVMWLTKKHTDTPPKK
jgi:formate dehydrogenase iron-sulfur subunit